MTAAAAAPDGTEWPYAEDLNGVWHHRPTGDDWDADGETQAATRCGTRIASVHVASFAPDRDGADKVCPRCFPDETEGIPNAERR